MNSNRAVFLLSLAAFASSANFRATDPLLPLLAAEFTVSVGAAASVVTAFAVSYGLLQVIYGPLGDRYGRYAIVSVMTLASALATLACAFATSLEALTLARFVSGAMVGGLIPVSMAWIGDVVAYEKRQAVIARFLLGQILGTAFGQAAAGVLAEAFGWRAIFLVLGALYVIVGVLLLMELRANPATRRSGGGEAPTMIAGLLRIVDLAKRPHVRLLVGTIFVEGMLMYGSLSFASAHLQQRFSIGPAAAGGMVAAFAAGGVVYAVGARQFLKAFGERGVAFGGGLALGAGFLLLPAVPVAWASVPCMLMVGVGFYMLHSTLQVHATQMAPEARGAAMSLFALCLFSGQSTGVWLGGRVVDAFGASPVFVVSGVGLAFLGWRFRERLKRNARDARAGS